MKARKFNKTIISLISVVLVVSLAFVNSCMDTAEPADEQERNLTVAVYRIIDQATGETKPVANSDIQIFRKDEASLYEAGEGTTNATGVASFSLDVPLIGQLYSISASYGGQTQTLSSVLICKDTTVRFIFGDESTNIACGDLDRSDSLIFSDYEGSRRLIVNTPENVNRYERCYSYSVSANSSGAVQFILDRPDSPFELISVSVGGDNLSPTIDRVDIQPGETLTFCFSVSTQRIGSFNQTLQFALSCDDGTQGTANLELQADVVEPRCDCEDIPETVSLIVEDIIPVGETYSFEDEELFVNKAACPVQVILDSSNVAGGWSFSEPNFPVNLGVGEALLVSGEFTPTTTNSAVSTLYLTIIPEGSGLNCHTEAIFEGEGCVNQCPFIRFDDGDDFETFGVNSPYGEILSYRDDNRVFISSVNYPSRVEKTYYVKNPDSACGEVEIILEESPADVYSSRYFSVSPTRFTLLPGEIGQVSVVFTAPTISALDDIVAARGDNRITSDSAFAVDLYIRGAGCEQVIKDTAIVTFVPDLSPIINLRAYAQRTPQQPIPENEVYYLGADSRTVLKEEDGTPVPPPPNLGDIWVDVRDTSVSAKPPQEPILKLVDNNLEVKRWRQNYMESDFVDVPNLVQEFQNDPTYNTGYGPGPITGIQVNEVYAFKFSENQYALIFIRRVDDGTENTSSKQSALEFRCVHPIFVY